MVKCLLGPFLLGLLGAACQAPQVAPSAALTTPADKGAAAAAPQEPGKPAEHEPAEKKGEDDLAGMQKELGKKERELGFVRVEHRVAALDRTVRDAGVKVASARAAEDLAGAQRDLEHFLAKERPRELDERRMQIDRSVHRAEHAKDELDELIAMYEADEFAKMTKELVLKRGRRSLEMAERELDIARREFAEYQEHALPKRERELRRKVDDAERAVQKAAIEAEKAGIEAELAEAREQAKVADLEAEIAELRAKIAAREPGR